MRTSRDIFGRVHLLSWKPGAMAVPRVSAAVPLFDPSRSSLAYGDRALPKLNRELRCGETAVCQQALLLLADVLHRRESLASALREGIAESLKELLTDSDVVVRQRSAKALEIIAQHALGRAAFLQLSMVTALSTLFADGNESVRESAHRAVEVYARVREGACGVVGAGLVGLLVERLVAEEGNTSLQVLILDTLHWCFQVDTQEGLQSHTLAICSELLVAKSAGLRGGAARIVFDLTVPLEGKEMACKIQGLVGSLVALLEDSEHAVVSQAVAALMSIAITTNGKYSVLKAGALPKLVTLLASGNTETVLNAIKALTMLAEAPSAKEQLQDTLDQLEAMHGREESVSRAAQIATKVISWKP